MLKYRMLPVHVWRSLVRNASSWQSSALRFSEYGDPEKVLQLVSETVSGKLGAKDVVLKILASPINPANINTIQGVYAIKPDLPAIGGSEAVGEVVQVGANVKNVQVGDRVIPAVAALGTWRNYMVISEDEALIVPKDVSISAAATIAVNPSTAFRMLYDFVSLGKDDVVVQNGANSAVGQAVIQIAAEKGWKTINIIRDRPNTADTAKFLADLGATHVVTDADLKRPDILKSLPKARLGLNCVGGKAVGDMLKLMDNGSTLVTYGGMSKQPMIVPTAAMIFKDVLLAGFWMTRWANEHPMEERAEMLEELCQLIREGKLKTPVLDPVLLDDFQHALKSSQEGYTGKKMMFVMDADTLEKVKQETRK